MFVSSSLILYVFIMMSITVGNMLLRETFLDTKKFNGIQNELKSLSKTDYDQFEYVKKRQQMREINFGLIWFNVITFIVMIVSLFMIEIKQPFIFMNHRLGIFSIMLLIIIESLLTSYLLKKLGVK